MKTVKSIAAFVLIMGLGTALAKAEDAKVLWERNCAACHGRDGKGDTLMGRKLGVKDYTDPKVQAQLKDDQMAKAIREGIKEGDKTKMKAFGDSLSEEEIKALVAHIKAFKKTE
jgi:mono/diheme cytochrome c family protein